MTIEGSAAAVSSTWQAGREAALVSRVRPVAVRATSGVYHKAPVLVSSAQYGPVTYIGFGKPEASVDMEKLLSAEVAHFSAAVHLRFKIFAGCLLLAFGTSLAGWALGRFDLGMVSLGLLAASALSGLSWLGRARREQSGEKP